MKGALFGGIVAWNLAFLIASHFKVPAQTPRDGNLEIAGIVRSVPVQGQPQTVERLSIRRLMPAQSPVPGGPGTEGFYQVAYQLDTIGGARPSPLKAFVLYPDALPLVRRNPAAPVIDRTGGLTISVSGRGQWMGYTALVTIVLDIRQIPRDAQGQGGGTSSTYSLLVTKTGGEVLWQRSGPITLVEANYGAAALDF